MMKRSFKEHIRRRIVSILTVLLLVSAGITFWRFLQPLEVEEDVPVCKYTQQARVDYLVHFRANNLFDEMTAGPGRGYITSLTDYIETQLVYQLNGDSPASVQGNVAVVAKVTGYNLQNKSSDSDEKEKVIIWEKTFPLLAPTPYSSNEARTEIKRVIPINLSQFRDFANQVNTAYFSPTQNIELTVFYNITAGVSNQKGTATSQVCPQLIIPLQGNTFAVFGALTDKKENAINSKEMVEVPGAQVARRVSAGVTVLLAVLLFLVLFATSAEIENPAEKELRQIIKKHGERVVSGILKLPEEFAQNTIVFHNFYDLVKVADEVAQPILYEELPEGSHTFYVINDPLIYRYSLEISPPVNIYKNRIINVNNSTF